ncbi:MAG: hypothetical protein M1816_008072 [Peltula sp. TS41687]|nr:MAG: hypothetical protein M1816_008072 [Peltula sp. TS41687]
MTDNNSLYDRLPNPDNSQQTMASPDVNGNYQSAKQSTMNSESILPLYIAHSFSLDAQSAMDSAQNRTQSLKDTVQNGPVAQQVKSEFANTQAEFQNLANSRTRPSHTAATGQQLTHYHSLFYNLLSWKNPRATSVAYLTTLALIFLFRYLPVVRYLFKATYISLGVTAAAEVVGKLVFGNGFTSQVRPRRYYTLPKETVDRVTDDFHELLNFGVIESQRLLFAENVGYTIAAFVASLSSYFLIKFLPLWGLAVIGTTVLYMGPLVYLKNKETIDAQLEHLTNVLNQQAHQVRDLTVHHTARATETVKHYAGDYSAKAQEYITHAKQRTSSATQEYSAKARDNLNAAKDRTASTAQDYSAKAQDNLAYAKDRTASTAQDVSARAQDNLTSAKDRTASAAQDYSVQAQDSAVNTKDRTASATNDSAAKAQDYMGAAKDRAAQAKDTLLSYLPGQKHETSSGQQTDGSATYRTADDATTYRPSDVAATSYQPSVDPTTYQPTDFPAAPAHPIADQFTTSEKNPLGDREPMIAS